MPLYESTFIARQDISAQQVEALAEEFSEIIRTNGGTVAKTEHWGLRNLAYRIKKNRKGHYVMLCIDAPHEALKEYERNMRINENILRYLSVRVKALPEGPSPIMLSRSIRDERRRDERSRPPSAAATQEKPAATGEKSAATETPAPTEDKAVAAEKPVKADNADGAKGDSE